MAGIYPVQRDKIQNKSYIDEIADHKFIKSYKMFEICKYVKMASANKPINYHPANNILSIKFYSVVTSKCCVS